MPPRAEEQESQIVDPDNPNESVLSPSPDPENRNPRLDAPTANNRLHENAPQRQSIARLDSFRSVVEETQYVEVELDTQATTSQPTQLLKGSPASERILQSNRVPSTAFPAEDNDIRSSFFARRPDDHEQKSSETGFRFGAALKPKAGQFIRPAPSGGSNNHSVITTSPSKDPSIATKKKHATSNILLKYVAQDQLSIVEAPEEPPSAKPLPSPVGSSKMPPPINPAPKQIPDGRSPLDTIVSTGYERPSANTEKASPNILHSAAGRNQPQHMMLPLACKDLAEELRSDKIPLPKAGDHNKPMIASQKNAPLSTVVAGSEPKPRNSTYRAERQNLGVRGKFVLLKENSQGDNPPQRGKHNGSETSVPPQRKNSKGRRGQMQVPFPEAAATSRKEGLRLHDSTQKPQVLYAQVENDVPRQIIGEIEPNIRLVRDPVTAAEHAEAERSLQRSASLSSLRNHEPRYTQGYHLAGIEFLHESGIPGRDDGDELSSMPHDVNQNPSRNSSSTIGVGRTEMQAPKSSQIAAHNTNQGKPTAKALHSDILCANESSPSPKPINHQESIIDPTRSFGALGCSSVPLNTRLPTSKVLINSNGPAQDTSGLEDMHHEARIAIPKNEESGDILALDVEAEHFAEPDLPPTIEGSPKVTSPAQTVAPPQPTSMRDNSGKGVMRPISPKDLQPTSSFASRCVHNSKVSKARGSQKPPTAASASQRHPLSRISELRSRYQNFMSSGADFDEILNDYERQQELLEAQQGEIDRLKASDQSLAEQLIALQANKLDLDEKVKKLTDLSTKYKKHMNEVVKTQKFLKAQSADIRNTKKEDAEVVAAYKIKDTVLRNLQAGIKEVKELRASTDDAAAKEKKHLDDANKYLEEVANKLSNQNKELRDDLKKFSQEKKILTLENIKIACENGKLGNENERLRRENDLCVAEIFKHLDYSEQLREIITAGEKTHDLLQQDLNKCVTELGREKSTVEKLQIVVQTQAATHKELLNLLKQTPTTVVEELVREGGVLARVFTSMNATDAKIDRATSLVENLKSCQRDPSAPLTKLIEDLFSRFQTEEQGCEKTRNEKLQSIIKLIEDLNSQVDQLRLDQEAKICLNSRITELEQMNHGLVTEKAAIERDEQNLTRQLNEVKRDLADAREQLNTKSNQLAAALAVPSEDPLLRAQLKILEGTKSGLENRLENANQNISKLKEEVQSLGEAMTSKEQEIQKLEGELNIAQTTIKKVDDEKIKDIAATKRENEEARQELIKNFETKKAALKTNFEAEIKRLDQKHKDMDAKLTSARGELRKYQEASITFGEEIKKINQKQKESEAELRSAGEEMQRLRETKTSLENTVEDFDRKHKERESELTSTREELRRFQEATTTADDSIKNLNERQRELETELRTSRAEVQKLLEGNTALEDTVKKEKAEKTSFKEMFAQQKAHLDRLDDRNPGRRVFDELQNGLQMARNEVSDLKNQLRFIKQNNAQKHEAFSKDQLTIESRLLQVDVLENERDVAENKATILRKELGELKEGLARKPLSLAQHARGYVGESVIRKTMTPVLEANRASRGIPLSTPEATLRGSTRQAGSGSESRQNRMKQSQAVLSHDQGTPNTLCGGQSGSAFPAVFPQTGATPRLRRTAERKSSNLKQLQQFQNAAALLPLPKPSHPQYHSTPAHGSASRLTGLQVDQNLGLALGVGPTTDEIPTTLWTPSEGVLGQADYHGGNGKTRNGSVQQRGGHNRANFSTAQVPGTHNSVRTVAAPQKRTRLQSTHDFHDDDAPLELCDETPPPSKKTKLAGIDWSMSTQTPRTEVKVGPVPSIEEESRKRRVSKPMKSALKKTVLNKDVLKSNQSEDQQHADVSKSERTAAKSRLARGLRGYGGLQPDSRGPGLENILGFVRGSNAKKGATAQSNVAQLGSAGKLLAKKPHSPVPHRPPRRGSNPKEVPGRRGDILGMTAQRRPSSSTTVIPDSQGTQ